MIQPQLVTKEELIREIEELRAERDKLLRDKDGSFAYIQSLTKTIEKIQDERNSYKVANTSMVSEIASLEKVSLKLIDTLRLVQEHLERLTDPEEMPRVDISNLTGPT